MTYLTPQEIATHRACLAEWRSPDDLAVYVDAVIGRLGSADFFSQPGLTFLREAWAAAQFGRHRVCDRVRLVPEAEQWPDFEVCHTPRRERFELVEVILPGRLRGKEYREAETRAKENDRLGVPDPVENWHARAQEILPALRVAVEGKAAKRYASGAALLIYLNIDEWGVRQGDIEAGFTGMVASALPWFAAVWILWKDRLYGPWQATQQS